MSGSLPLFRKSAGPILTPAEIEFFRSWDELSRSKENATVYFVRFNNDMGKPGSLYIRVPDDITIEKLQAWVEAKSKRPWTLWKIQVADDSKTSTNNIVQVKMNAPDSRRGAKTA